MKRRKCHLHSEFCACRYAKKGICASQLTAPTAQVDSHFCKLSSQDVQFYENKQ